MPRRGLPGLLLPVPLTLLTYASTGDPPAPAGRLGSVSCGVTAPFPLGLGVCRILSVPSKTRVCLPPSCGSLVVTSPCPSGPNFLGIPSPFVGSVGWEAWRGVQNLPNSGRTSLVLLFCSPVCGSPTWQVWDLILSWLYSSYCLTVASSLSLDVGYLFLVGSKVPSMVGQQLVAILVLS